MCIRPTEFKGRLGDFGEYCPVKLANDELVDNSTTRELTYAAEFRGNSSFILLCSVKNIHLSTFSLLFSLRLFSIRLSCSFDTLDCFVVQNLFTMYWEGLVLSNWLRCRLSNKHKVYIGISSAD